MIEWKRVRDATVPIYEADLGIFRLQIQYNSDWGTYPWSGVILCYERTFVKPTQYSTERDAQEAIETYAKELLRGAFIDLS